MRGKKAGVEAQLYYGWKHSNWPPSDLGRSHSVSAEIWVLCRQTQPFSGE